MIIDSKINASNILYLMSSANLFGGTPKKTLDLIKHTRSSSYIYFWSDEYNHNHTLFKKAGAKVYEGDYGRNVIRHIRSILKIVDENNIHVIQTQFSFGELLACIVKRLRPNLKIIIAFVGPFSPSGIKRLILNSVYKKMDYFVYISEYVKKEKLFVFNSLKNREDQIIYNGTERRKITNSDFKMKSYSLFSASGLVDWKNIVVLVDAMTILIKKFNRNDIYVYIAGDGPEREALEKKIAFNGLENNIFLLGYQENIGGLLNQCDIYVHPAYAEGFGIAVAEAMMAEKPLILSNAGALPELIENGNSGLIVDPFDAMEWASTIVKLVEDKSLSENLAKKAKNRALTYFSVEKYVSTYEKLYSNLLNK